MNDTICKCINLCLFMWPHMCACICVGQRTTSSVDPQNHLDKRSIIESELTQMQGLLSSELQKSTYLCLPSAMSTYLPLWPGVFTLVLNYKPNTVYNSFSVSALLAKISQAICFFNMSKRNKNCLCHHLSFHTILLKLCLHMWACKLKKHL